MAGSPDDPRNRLGASLRVRQRPLRDRRTPVLPSADGPGAVGRRAALGRLGDLGRLSRTFASAAGLSLSSRRALGGDAPGSDVASMPVAPPPQWGDAVAAGAVPSTGDAVLDRLIARSRAARPAASTPRRGLLSAVRRQTTPAGPDTGPASAARRLRPVATPTAQNPEVRQALGGDAGAPADRGRPGPSGPPGAGRPGGAPRSTAAAPRPRPGDRSPRGGWSAAAVDPARPGGATTPPATGSAPRPPIDLRTRTVAEGASAAARRLAGVSPLATPDPERATGTVGAPAGAPVPTSVAAPAADRPSNAPASAEGPAPLVRAASPLPPGLSPPARRTTSTASTPGATPTRLPAALAASSPTMAGTHAPTLVPAGAPASPVVAPTGPAAVAAATPAGLNLDRSGATPASPSPALRAALSRTSRAGVTLASLPTGGPGARAPRPAPRPTSQATSSPAPTGAPSARPGPSTATGSPAAAAPVPAASPTSAPSAPPAPAGVGSVATRLLTASGATTAPARASSSSSSSSPALAAATDRLFGGPVATGASRALRSLPDLGSVTPPPTAAPRAAVAATATDRGAGGPRGAGSVPAQAAGPAPVGTPSPTRSSPAASTATPAAGRPAPTLPSATSEHAAETPRVAASDALPVAPAAAPLPDIADPAERFQRELERHPAATRPAPARLPHRFEPIARALLPGGSARARVSSDEASRRALASVGKVAATTGDVIHLARPLDATPRSAEIVAHELTHVAAPSPAPRFFADERDSPEERRARAVGQAMAQAPVGSPPVAPPVVGDPGARPSGWNRAGAPTSAPAAGGIGGHRVARTPSAPAPANTPPVGAPSVGVPSAPPPSVTGTPTPATPSHGAPSVSPTAGGFSGVSTPGGSPGADTADASDAAAAIDVERLLDALEARILRELERRGRRWPRMI